MFFTCNDLHRLSRLQCVRVIFAPRIPEDPAIEAVVIARLDLGANLYSTVNRRTECEILVPRNYRCCILQSSAAFLHVLERSIDCCIRIRVRIAETVRAGRKMRWINHWKHNVCAIDEHLPALPDAHVGCVSRGETKDIDRHRHPRRLEHFTSNAELIVNYLRPCATMLQRKYSFAREPIVVRKTNVVELHRAEASIVRLARKIDCIRP